METVKSTPNRVYKATIFAMLFEDKEHLLELYNAVSGKQYTNPEMLEINTLENAIYMAMRNDISFLIDARQENIKIVWFVHYKRRMQPWIRSCYAKRKQWT